MISTQTIQERLASLEAEEAKGLEMIRNLDAQRQQVINTLQSIGGAKQVLREFLPAETATNEQPSEGLDAPVVDDVPSTSDN